MTEAEWLACNHPEQMLGWLTGQVPPPTERKLRLFLVGCARQVWDMIPPGNQREAVLTAERYADGNATPEELSSTRRRYYELSGSGQLHGREGFLIYCLAYAGAGSSRLVARPLHSTHWVGISEMTSKHLPGLIRCVFGNPFRTVAADPSWLTSDVIAIATGVYEARDFDRLPILADALQDAGCDSGDILNHLRSVGPHVRGCWALDLVLGKS